MKWAAAVLSLAILQQVTSPVEMPLQRIVATVRDESGQLVRNLRAGDFILEEDGAPQEVRSFVEDTDVPVSLGILIDESGSMGGGVPVRRYPGVVPVQGRVSGLRAAVGTTRVLLRLMKPGDEFVLMSFDDGVSVRQGFTDDVGMIEEALPKLNASGSTNLIGGVVSALKEIKKAKHRKRALVVLSDADANSGDLKTLAQSIQDAEVMIYTFALRDNRKLASTPGIIRLPFGAILDTLEQESGGRSVIFDVSSEDLVQQMAAFVKEIAAELRGQYTLGYYPARVEAVEKRVIRVRTTTPGTRVRVLRQVDAPSHWTNLSEPQ